MPDFYKQKGSDVPWTVIFFQEDTAILLDCIPMRVRATERLAFSKEGKFKLMNTRQFEADFEPVEDE